MAPLGHRERFPAESVERVDCGERVWDDDVSVIFNYLTCYIYLLDFSESLPTTAGRKATSHNVERQLRYTMILRVSGEY
jgi:hypothetical protein